MNSASITLRPFTDSTLMVTSPVSTTSPLNGALPSLYVMNPVTAGYSALSELSDMAPENERIFAMSQSEARGLDAEKIKKYNGVQIEVWRYDPRLLADKGRVDPLSLYLSLKDSPDARINIAVESLLENVL